MKTPTEACSPPKHLGCSRRRRPAWRRSSIDSGGTSRAAVACAWRAVRMGTSARARERKSAREVGVADMVSFVEHGKGEMDIVFRNPTHAVGGAERGIARH